MNIDTLENQLDTKFVQKFEKRTVKIKMKLLYVNKKCTSEKTNFCVQTSFSLSTLFLEQKKFTPQTHSLFRSTSFFAVTKMTTSI